MHAVVINVTINDRPGVDAELSTLVPQVAAAPGFVAAYWVAVSEEKGASIVVFDSEQAAQGLAAVAAAAPGGPITTNSIEVGEVIAHA